MFCGLKNISENYEGEVNNYELLGPSQRQAILDQILQCAEDEAKRAEDEAKSAPIDSGLIVFEERLSIIIENVKQHLDEEKKTRMDFIENANIQINYLKCALEMLQDKIKLLKELDTSLIAMCQDADHLIIYERLLEDLD
jgi:hypothetical protein